MTEIPADPTSVSGSAYRRPVSRVGDASLVAARRRQIVDAAASLISRQGFAKTVIRDIATEADCSVGLVYEYVRTKEDILFLMFESAFATYREGLTSAVGQEGNPLDRLVHGIRFLVEEADRRREYILVWYRETAHLTDDGREMVKSGDRELASILGCVIEEAVSQGLLRGGIDPIVTASMILVICYDRALRPYLTRDSMTPSRHAGAIVSMIFDGIATERGRDSLKGSAS